MVPATMKAVVTTCNGTVELTKVPVPRPGRKELLVKVMAVAQNPSDWKSVDYNNPPAGNIVGCDFTGVVEEIGSEVPEGLHRVGEHVAGGVFGAAFPNRGSFAEYLIVNGEHVISVPDDLPFEGAAGIGAAGFTTCQMLYQSQNLATPANPTKMPTPVLVWSGASSVGQYVIQVAKASGYTVIATASPKNHDLLKELGADAIFDYKDPNVGTKIRAYTNGKLEHAFDCISELDTPQKVSDSLSPSGGTVSIILEYESVREEVEVKFSLAYTLTGLMRTETSHVPLIPEHYEACKMYAKLLSQLVWDGKLKMTPVKIMPNGLASVNEGFNFQRSGQVSGQKITYIIADTP